MSIKNLCFMFFNIENQIIPFMNFLINWSVNYSKSGKFDPFKPIIYSIKFNWFLYFKLTHF